jgi:hypothetical protein
MEGSNVYSQSEFIQVFLRKGRIRIQLLKWFQNFWSFKGRTSSVPLFKIESLMMMRHTNFSFIVGYL